MKSRVLGILVLMFSLAAFAGKVPQAQLEKVNAQIAMLLGGFSEYVTVEITDANRSKKTKLLTSANVKAKVLGVADVDLGLKTKKNDITLTGSVSGKAVELGFESDDLVEMVKEANKFVEAINKKGDYKAALKMKGTEKGTKLKLTMVPTKANKNPSIKKFEVNGFLPTDSTATAKISLEGKFKGGADNVKVVRESVTNIFDSLAAEEMPNSADFEALGKVIATMLESMEDIDADLE